MSAVEQPSSLHNPYGDDYKWPDNLYDELSAMSVVASFVYYFAYITNVARKSGEPLKGLQIDPQDEDSIHNSIFATSYTPAEVKALIQDNQEILAIHYSSIFGIESEHLSQFYNLLDALQERADSYTTTRMATIDSAVPNDEMSSMNDAGESVEVQADESRPFEPITLETFDDQYQRKELVYGITRDSVNKRITIIIRGTDSLAMFSNWKANLNAFRKDGHIPDSLKGVRKIKIHRGFYDYLFKKTVTDTDAKSTTKYDQIIADVKNILKNYPDHKIYVTGHSLGAAVATLAGFYLSCDPEIPKPVSSISFASPRVGDASFLNVVQYQEQTKQLRVVRAVNDNDTIAVIPTFAYKHVGFQVTLYKNPKYKPVVHYPSKSLTYASKLKIKMRNSLFASLNFSYDHGDQEYVRRIEEGKSVLEGLNVNVLYNVPTIVGFELEDGNTDPIDETFVDHS